MSCYPRSSTVDVDLSVWDRSTTRPGGQRAAGFMPPKYEYRRRLPHIQKDNRPIFITFATDHRWELPPEARDSVLECCLWENSSKFDLHTAVVMPDYVHLLLSPLRDVGGWKLQPAPNHACDQGCLGQSGRKNSSIRSYDRMTGLRRRVIISVRIRCERDWSQLRVSIAGCGGVLFRFSGGKKRNGLSGPPDRVRDPVPHGL